MAVPCGARSISFAGSYKYSSRGAPPPQLIMSVALTFTDKKIIDTALVDPTGAVHYTTSTTSGLMGRKMTTISAASGLVGFINWREKVFVINGVRQSWEDLKHRSNGIFSGSIFLYAGHFLLLESGNGIGPADPTS